MRKSNNVMQWTSDDGNSFWVVYDMGTDETLTFYDDDDLDKCEWQRLIIEEGVGGDLEKIEDYGRFDSADDARVAASNLADHILMTYPDDDVQLEVRQIIYEMTAMVTAVHTVTVMSGIFDRDQSAGEERILDLQDETDSVAQENEDEQESHGVYSGAFSDEMILTCEDEEEEPISSWTSKNFDDPTMMGETLKKTKVKKSARSKSKVKGSKKSRA